MSDHEPTSLSSVIRERRRALGLSQGQLAAKVGENLVDVRHWEEGEALPTAAMLEKVAKALDVDPTDLASLAGAPDVSGELVLDDETGIGGDSTVTVEVLVPETPDEADERWSAMWGEERAAVDDQEGENEGTPGGGVVREDSASVAVPAESIPTEAVAAPPSEMTGLPVVTRSQPSVAIEPPVSYIEDPIQYRIYWLRAALLAIAAVVLLAVLAWAFGELATALGQLLDQFTAGI